MNDTLINLVYVNEIYRYVFLVSSFFAFIILLFGIKENSKNRGFVYFALIYFFCVFIFYLGRIFHIPSDPLLTNLFSNIIRTIGEISIFFTAYLLLKDGANE